jgi:hypothetical protein
VALDPDVERFIMDHINTKLAPLEEKIKDIKEETEHQSKILFLVNRWKDEFWGNGKNSGNGYMEKARAEDKTVQRELFAKINAVQGTVEILSKERNDAQMESKIRKQIAEEQKSAVQDKREVQSLRLSKWQLIAALISIPALAYFLDPIKHLLALLFK